MNFNDHAPPHFHAKYDDYHITVEIKTGIVNGRFPRRALRHVMDWYEMHQDEILDNWNSIQDTGEFHKITPLE